MSIVSSNGLIGGMTPEDAEWLKKQEYFVMKCSRRSRSRSVDRRSDRSRRSRSFDKYRPKSDSLQDKSDKYRYHSIDRGRNRNHHDKYNRKSDYKEKSGFERRNKLRDNQDVVDRYGHSSRNQYDKYREGRSDKYKGYSKDSKYRDVENRDTYGTSKNEGEKHRESDSRKKDFKDLELGDTKRIEKMDSDFRNGTISDKYKESGDKNREGDTYFNKYNEDSELDIRNPDRNVEKYREHRKSVVEKWRHNNCATDKEQEDQLEEIMKLNPDEIIESEKSTWIRSAPAELYYNPSEDKKSLMGTDILNELCDRFDSELVQRGRRVRESKPKYEPPPRKRNFIKHKCCPCSDSSDSSSEEENDDNDNVLKELERKRSHPDRIHPELWHNEPGEMNDGPLCRCSAKAKRSGIRHNIYAGELTLNKCNVNSNNSDKLYHYRITISPPTNFLVRTPTIILHDEHEYIFEGFSMFSHKPLENLPYCKVIRFNIEYTILYIEEQQPDNFTIRELNLFYDYLFKELLELVDLDLKAVGDEEGCAQFHFMPRFVRELPKNGKEVLSMNEVLTHLLDNNKLLVDGSELKEIIEMPKTDWQNMVDEIKGMIVTYPGKKPCSVRVDQLDRDQSEAPEGQIIFPEIIHFGIRPPQLSYAGNPEYQKAWREYMKFRHLLANMPKVSPSDKRKLEVKENALHEMRSQNKMKRDVTVAISSQGFYRTGIMCDIVQHAMLIPVLVSHLRFHRSLDVLETNIKYQFQNRSLLQLALTHPSYRENFGTNPDHARNSLTNCGIRQPEYGDRRIHYMNTRKRGINTLINIMSRFGKLKETESNIRHNERLEFLGDAVVEFVTSIHLFHMFPRLEEGGLATYRAAIVQNQHLAVLAKVLRLDEFMLYAHGSDLCHDLELRHAMANCFEALMGALFLDGGIEIADNIFGLTLFVNDDILRNVWFDYPPHPLQDQEPEGDRKWIEKFKILQDLTKFEESIGVEFTHIRLLARAFTDRSIGYTNLTMGSNQRLEFLGDTVLQLIASEYLYKFFPEHHEGHLSLLRSSLVNNRTQAVVCDDLGMSKYAIYANPKADLKTKDRADLLESFLGALYIDKGMFYCKTFCNVCFFPRLQHFIMHQDWNDPKSKLQQCCLTLRTMEGGEPEIPIYKVIQCMGPTNTRLYTVAVYFKDNRLAQATGHSIQQAEMNAAKKALQNSHSLFPQLDHQRRIIAKSMKKQTPKKYPIKRPHDNSNMNLHSKRQKIYNQVNRSDSGGSKSLDDFDRYSDRSSCSSRSRDSDRNSKRCRRDNSPYRSDSRTRGRDFRVKEGDDKRDSCYLRQYDRSSRQSDSMSSDRDSRPDDKEYKKPLERSDYKNSRVDCRDSSLKDKGFRSDRQSEKTYEPSGRDSRLFEREPRSIDMDSKPSDRP